MEDEPEASGAEKPDETKESAGAVKAGPVSVPKDLRFVRAVDGLAAFPIEGWLWKLEKKRSANRKRHDDAVRRKSPNSKKLDELGVLAAKQIAEWGTEADAYGEDEPEISAAWQAALDRIYVRDRSAGTILESLKRLSSVELLDFLDCIEMSQLENPRSLTALLSLKPSRLASKLEDLGLIKSDLRRYIVSVLLIVLTSVALIVAMLLYSIYLPRSTLIPIPQVAGLTGLGTLVLGTILGYGQYLRRFSLTEAGRMFASTYQKYAPKPSKRQRPERKST